MFNKMHRLFFIIPVIAVASLAVCGNIKVNSVQAPGYSEKIDKVLILENRGLADKYPMLSDRTGLVIQKLKTNFEENKIPVDSEKVSAFTLNTNSIRNASNASHILSVTVTTAQVRVHVDYYSLLLTLTDKKTGKEVWKSTVDANWYSKPDEIANSITKQLLVAR